MSISKKVTSIVVLAFLVSVLLNFLIQKMFIMPSFVALEKETAAQNAQRALGAIVNELELISPTVSDWAHWTETYEYALGKNPEYADDNLDDLTTLGALKMNYMGIYQLTGEAIWNIANDLQAEEVISVGELTETQLPVNHPLLRHPDLHSEVKAIVATSRSPMLVVAQPILTNDEEGPIAGVLIFGRFLDDAIVEKIGSMSKLKISLAPVADTMEIVDWLGADTADRGLIYSPLDFQQESRVWKVSTVVGDLNSQPILSLEVETARDISAQGQSAVSHSMWLLIVTGMAVMMSIWVLLKSTIIRPLEKLTQHSLKIAEHDDLSAARLDFDRKDEIGTLAAQFDEMVEKLAQARRRDINQSYHSGIAEMASGVLHNIGNALTPLKVGLQNVCTKFQSAPIAEIEQASSELAAESTPDSRRSDLTKFVELAAVEITRLVKEGSDDLSRSVAQTEQIQGILEDQRKFSRSERVLEQISMDRLVRDVEQSLTSAMKTSMQVAYAPNLTEVGSVRGSYVALMQVVTNIFINAYESITRADNDQGQLRVEADVTEENGNRMVCTSFIDNGTGFMDMDVNKIFERGYSTKSGGDSGYGLHWSANTILSLGGVIRAENNENGGATIRLVLPAADSNIETIQEYVMNE